MKEIAKVIVVPDSFKGGMSAAKFCEITGAAIHKVFPAAQVISIPVADGGEGTVDAFLAAIGGEKIQAIVKGPFFDEMESFYAMLPDKTAVIEVAACAGLPLAKGRENPLDTTTYGVGQLIRHAINYGCKSIILGMGGSATNDAGCGMACALGARFYRENGNLFIPTGGTLCDITRIDTSELQCDVPITAMCDVDTTLYGAQGAAYVFAPQKGANAEAVKLLDDGLRHFACTIMRINSRDITILKGGGAAGGLGAGAVCFLNARLRMGIEVVLDAAGFDAQLEGADLVITGEGKIDGQSLRGKVVSGVAKRAKLNNIPVIAVVGDIEDPIDEMYEIGVDGVFSINRMAIPFDKAVQRSENDLHLTIENIMRFLRALG